MEKKILTTQMKNRTSITIYMKQFLAILLLPIIMISCSDGTATIGVVSDSDDIENSYEIFNIYTHSVLLDSVVYNNSYNYLGCIKDPETNTDITAKFAAQFHTFENYKFPQRNSLFYDLHNNHSQDPIECDSIDMQLYFNGYYGDPNNPMKLEVYPLSFDNIIEEDSIYYVNTDLEQFVDAGAKPIVTKVFTAIDYSISKTVREDEKYTNHMRIALPKEFGDELLNAYYEHPEYYKNSYTFIRNLCPGFYFKIKSGTGTMINVSVSTLNLYFTYYESIEPDSIESVGAICRFAATPEVIQSTQFTNGNLQDLADDNNCTYLKSPAGIGTEITIPISQIYANHQNDSISKAQVTLTRYNSIVNNDYTLDIPKNVLMVRKDDVVSFFMKHKIPDNQTSFCTEFDPTYNTYSFENLGRLITYCRYEKQNGMSSSGMSEAQWEAAHPNWNKVVIIPVSVKTTTDSYGNTSYASVSHEMTMCSARLAGGPYNPIKMQVLFSRFK